MKPLPLLLLSLVSAATALVAPVADPGAPQVVLGSVPGVDDAAALAGTQEALFEKLRAEALVAKSRAEALIAKSRAEWAGGAAVERWVHAGREYIKQHGTVYELLTHPAYAGYQMRVTEPTLCDPDVQQYSGYLDISDGKHLFFWFFESRVAPEDAPLLLWLNGGPGCSSSTGLLFELGPCRIAHEGRNTTRNPHSWNTHANVLFLDQPVDVGFSYASDGSRVSTSPAAGVDVLAFLQLFLARYPRYAAAPFHLAAESYGGTYAPHIATAIHLANIKRADAPPPARRGVHINLASVVLANGHTDPYVQFAAVPEFACNGPYPVFADPDGEECAALRSKVPTCQRLVKSCYDYNSRLACVPAAMYCNSQLYGPVQQLGLNPYDVRRKCDRAKDGDLCYTELGWVDAWMNDVDVKRALGVDPAREFHSCNLAVNQAFLMQGDGMHNSALLLPPLLDAGVRLLVYAGNADYMCNFIGNEAWLLALESSFQDEFTAAATVPWVTLKSGGVAGAVRTAGGGGSTAGNVTFVAVHEAGHMVPFDQPKAALDLITRWISNVPLTLNATEAAAAAPHCGLH